MPKNRERSGEEFWRSKCRELEKRVRQLERALKSASKNSLKSFESSQCNEKHLQTLSKTSFETCPECGKGQIIMTDFKYVKFNCCNTCDWKEKVK